MNVSVDHTLPTTNTAAAAVTKPGTARRSRGGAGRARDRTGAHATSASDTGMTTPASATWRNVWDSTGSAPARVTAIPSRSTTTYAAASAQAHQLPRRRTTVT